MTKSGYNNLDPLLTRRALFTLGVQGLLVVGLSGQLVWLQGYSRHDLRAKADGNRINIRALIPERGVIRDRNNIVLAITHRALQVYLYPYLAEDVNQTLKGLSQFLTFDQSRLQRIKRSAARHNRYQAIKIADNLTWAEFSRLSIYLSKFPAAELQQGQKRYYPFSEITAHALGYVAPVSTSEREQTRDLLLQQPDYQIGKTGVEKYYEQQLRGVAGTQEIEVNANGQQIRKLKRVKAQVGSKCNLALDLRVQQFLYEQFKSYRRAAGVLLDINSGEVVASVTKPAFDPNLFSKGLDDKTWQQLLQHEDKPLTDRVIAGQYSPGSTFKIVSLLAGLESGYAHNSQFRCDGVFRLGRQNYHCWKRAGHGKVDAVKGFRWSCDIWFYNLALQMGLEPMTRAAHKLGFGQTTAIDLVGELPGLVPTKEWRQQRFKAPWQQGETIINAIGQGFLLTTPLQLALMTARIASGRNVVPCLRLRSASEIAEMRANHDGNLFSPLLTNSEHLSFIRQLMYDVVNLQDGTGRSAYLTDPTMAISGKTGTAQVRRITTAEREAGIRKNEDVDWRLRDHSLFVAFAPSYRPKWSIAVVVEHAGSGSRHAAPIAAKVLRLIQTLHPNRTGSSQRLA